MESSNKPNEAESATVEEIVLNQTRSPPNRDNDGGPNILQHPLLIAVVVDRIVKYLSPDFEELKALRLVSKIWTQVTLHHWRNSCAVLTFVPDPPLFSKSQYQTGVTVPQFFQEFNDPQSSFQLAQKPFLKYKLKDFKLNFEVCSSLDGLAHQFWTTIGPLMKSVHFYKCMFERPVKNTNAVCPRVEFIGGMIPNLQDLELTDMTTEEAEKYWKGVEIPEEDETEPFQIFEKKLHSNLRSLTVYGDLKKEMSLCELLLLAPGLEIIQGVNQHLRPLLVPIHRVRYNSVTQRRPLANLKHIDVINSTELMPRNYPQKMNWTEASISRQVPLETLSLHTVSFHEDTGSLDLYVKSFKNSLKAFKVLRAPAGPPYSNFLSGACMSALNELYLLGTIAPNFEFLKCTPNLTKLEINLECFENRSMLKAVIEQHNEDSGANWKYEKYQEDMVFKVRNDLKESILCSALEYLQIDYPFSEKSLRLLGKWAPNLKILKTILSVETVPVVCEVWRELTELVCLHGSKVDNSCFIRDENKAGFSKDLPAKLKICDLKDLERFQLEAYCDERELTDDVVFHGFLKMTGLRCLDICVNSKMTVEAEEALRKGIPFCTVVRDDSNGCRGSKLVGSLDFSLCDRCAFRLEVIYGVYLRHSYVSEERENDGIDNSFWSVSQSESSDEDASSSSGDSFNSADTL